VDREEPRRNLAAAQRGLVGEARGPQARQLQGRARQRGEGQAEKQRVENFQKTWNERSAKAAAKYADFKEVALDPAMPIVPGGIVDAFIGETEVGPELLYHFGKNPAELEKLQGMNPIHAALELAKLVGKFTEPEAKLPLSTPAKPTITSAPKPAPKVGGRGTAPEDPVAAAVKDDDFEAFEAAANARDLAK
jgi:hypothetical protein